MEQRGQSKSRRTASELVKTAGFKLGPLAIDPPALRINAGSRSEAIEPRAMQVLVALGEEPGTVLSRDDLIEACWNGQIVTDNAIDRVMSRVRRVLNDLGGGAVVLETIPRVGFRIVAGSPPAAEAPPQDSQPDAAQAVPFPGGGETVTPLRRRAWTRRAAAGGLAAAAGAALGWAAWFRQRRHVPDPRAAELYRRGQEIQKAGVAESMGDAIELYKQAVAIDPGYADAWAGIAIGHRYPVIGAKLRLGDPREVRVAAARALALDPDNAEARLALIELYPAYRRRLEYETQLRAFLGDHPDSPLGHALLAWLLLEVGRLGEAIAAATHTIEIDPMQQFGWFTRVLALSYAGRKGEADLAVEEARSRWPRHFHIWYLGYMVLIDSGRPAEALAYLRDTIRLPRSIGTFQLEAQVISTQALATGQGIAEYRTTNRHVPAAVLVEALPVMVSKWVYSGLTDELFALFEAYYFGGIVNGTRVAPPGPLDTRVTFPLFAPAVLSLRGDPRHASLLERIGLEDYWRKSGTQPDFRKR